MKKLEYITAWVIVVTVFCGLSVHGERVRRTSINCPQSCSCGLFNNDKKSINCSNTEKTNVPQDIPGDSTLVDLSNNVITGIGRRDFNQMVQLRTVDLSRNTITVGFPMLKDPQGKVIIYKKQKPVYFNNNNVMCLSNVESIYYLTPLVLKSNLPSHIFTGRYMTQLKRLVASNNLFPEIPYGRLPTGLEYVDVSCLEMRMLRARTFRGLLHLKEIRITGCDAQQRKLTAIERGTFQSMPSLQLLDLKDNALTRIPKGLPTNILVLDLSHNSLLLFYAAQSNIGSELSSLTVLRKLDLSGNRIGTVQNEMQLMLPSLRKADFSNNPYRCDCHITSFVDYVQTTSVLLLNNNLSKSKVSCSADGL
uniref:LRRNT domain-containing protein n=1 Tax=Ciona intestinalis TaxID=7719 RepID=F7BI09_CIOIN